MAMTQEQYWKELYQLKAHINYVEILYENADQIDRTLKIILAVAASTSIGAWVIWKNYAWVWASVIAFSQVITAINPFLPYKERIKDYGSLLHELEEILIQAEFKWHSIAEGELTEPEINQARFEIRSQKLKSLKKHITGTTIPRDEKARRRAEDSAREYFETFYPG